MGKEEVDQEEGEKNLKKIGSRLSKRNIRKVRRRRIAILGRRSRVKSIIIVFVSKMRTELANEVAEN